MCICFGSNQIDDRYVGIREIASTRAILSMGLACYKVHGDKGHFANSSKSVYEQIRDCLQQDDDHTQDEEKVIHVTVDVFNFLCMCQNDFIIEPKSMEFLVAQGFDFNELFKSGIPYFRGNDVSG